MRRKIEIHNVLSYKGHQDHKIILIFRERVPEHKTTTVKSRSRFVLSLVLGRSRSFWTIDCSDQLVEYDGVGDVLNVGWCLTL